MLPLPYPERNVEKEHSTDMLHLLVVFQRQLDSQIESVQAAVFIRILFVSLCDTALAIGGSVYSRPPAETTGMCPCDGLS